MAKTNGTNERNEEVDADRLIRSYEESNQVLPAHDEDNAGVDVEWYEQANEDTFEPSETVLTGGDIDADWEQARFRGDEVIGGSTPTPEQDIVEEIGKAMGVTYEDAESLRPEEKIAKRDEARWELNPVSSEDFEERQTSKEGP